MRMKINTSACIKELGIRIFSLSITVLSKSMELKPKSLEARMMPQRSLDLLFPSLVLFFLQLIGMDEENGLLVAVDDWKPKGSSVLLQVSKPVNKELKFSMFKVQCSLNDKIILPIICFSIINASHIYCEHLVTLFLCPQLLLN